MNDKNLNVIFCGSIDEFRSRSWGKTNSYLLNHLESKVCIKGHLDYTIHSRYLKFSHKLYCWLFLGQLSLRDDFLNFFMERKFLRAYRKLDESVDVFIHTSTMCIPKSLMNTAIHVLYIDATIKGGMQYNNVRLNRRNSKVFNKITQKYTERYTLIFTFNEWARKSLIDDFSVDPGKIFNIGFGANLNPFTGKKDYTNGLILTILRRGLEENKGLFLLLQGFRIARKENRNLKLAVVGTQLEPEDGVVFYENYPRSKTLELFREASLFALPALFEPNGMVYTEALANKTPILGLNRLAFPEFSMNGEYGFIIETPKPEEIAETLLYAMSDPARLEKMGTNGQLFSIDRYSWSKVTDRMVRHINERIR